MDEQNLPVIQFDNQGLIKNLDEIFHNVPYGQLDRAGDRGRSTRAWLSSENRLVNGLDKYQFFWGIVLVGMRESQPPYLKGGHHYYRVHPLPESHTESIPRCTAGSVNLPKE